MNNDLSKPGAICTEGFRRKRVKLMSLTQMNKYDLRRGAVDKVANSLPKYPRPDLHIYNTHNKLHIVCMTSCLLTHSDLSSTGGATGGSPSHGASWGD